MAPWPVWSAAVLYQGPYDLGFFELLRDLRWQQWFSSCRRIWRRLRHIKGLFNPNPRYPRPAPGDLSSFPHINPYVTRPPRHRGLCLEWIQGVEDWKRGWGPLNKKLSLLTFCLARVADRKFSVAAAVRHRRFENAPVSHNQGVYLQPRIVSLAKLGLESLQMYVPSTCFEHNGLDFTEAHFSLV